MAVVEETPYVDEDGVQHDDLVRHYSDDGKPLVQLQTGKLYDEAIDKTPCKYTYAEYEETTGETSAVETETPTAVEEETETSESTEGDYES